jgi:hypothetical protein
MLLNAHFSLYCSPSKRLQHHSVMAFPFLQATTSLVPQSAATHFILAMDKWKKARSKRRQERRVAKEVEGHQRWPAKLVTDISEP